MNEDNESRFRAVLAGLNDGIASIDSAAEAASSLMDELPAGSPFELALKRVTRRKALAETLADDIEILQRLSRRPGGA